MGREGLRQLREAGASGARVQGGVVGGVQGRCGPVRCRPRPPARPSNVKAPADGRELPWLEWVQRRKQCWGGGHRGRGWSEGAQFEREKRHSGS